MTCILVAGTKGGGGKTTVATNLAVMLQISGRATLLVDLDKESRAHSFAQRRLGRGQQPPITSAQLSGEQIHQPIQDLAGRYDAVVLDCGGHDSVEMRAALATPCLTQVVLPTQPSYYDLESIITMSSLVNRSRALHTNPNLPACVVFNRVKSNQSAQVLDEARAFVLEEVPSLELFDGVLHDLVAFSYSVPLAQAVMEYDRRSAAAQEMIALYEHLMKEPMP